jgi:hypothetical protein
MTELIVGLGPELPGLVFLFSIAREVAGVTKLYIPNSTTAFLIGMIPGGCRFLNPSTLIDTFISWNGTQFSTMLKDFAS